MRKLVVVLAALSVAMVLATMAAADKPYSYQFTAVGSGTLDNACSFPIVVNFNATFTGRDFYDDGALTKTQYQVKGFAARSSGPDGR